ncbi:MAG TPA: hypothetical protein PKO25_01650 [Spirochaetota bacterium]|nr:hypothetical protein [Spirochaetota bacterium]HPV96931.1 hypothetical protein [Spirochaetota bacterium]
MQFLFLLMVNVILWVVFYLVISLKLERSASEFREKRMRREMDAIIKEFNETAERNITLLENRITAMKRLMRQGGVIKNLDLNVGDATSSPTMADAPGDVPAEPAPVSQAGRIDPEGLSPRGDLARLSHGVAGILRAIVGKSALFLLERVAGKDEAAITGRDESKANKARTPDGTDAPAPGSIQKDLSELAAVAAREPQHRSGRFDEADISGLFDGTEDKYALISDLHGKGCPVELISRCSGIPAGEIRLVLNLRSKQ